jgi:hypothetical protein
MGGFKLFGPIEEEREPYGLVEQECHEAWKKRYIQPLQGKNKGLVGPNIIRWEYKFNLKLNFFFQVNTS